MEFREPSADEKLIRTRVVEAIEASDRSAIERDVSEHRWVFEGTMWQTWPYRFIDDCAGYAARRNELQVLKLLLEQGANIDAKFDQKAQVGMIHHAVTADDRTLDTLRWLLERGAVINSMQDSMPVCPPLLSGTQVNAPKSVQLLVEHGAAINGLSRRGLSPLDHAEMFGHREVAEYLRSQGALHGWEVRGESPPKPPAFVEHLESNLGKVDPLSLQQLIPSGVPIRIHRAQVKDEQFLITEGMAAQPMIVPAGAEKSGLRFAEVMIRLPKKWKLTGKALDDPTKRWPIEWLFRVARWPNENKTWLGPVAIIANGEPPQPFAKNTKLCCMFAKPAGYDFATWKLPDGETGTIYQLYPIYAEEREVERTHGWEALMAAFEENDFPLYIDPDRPNVYREFIEEE